MIRYACVINAQYCKRFVVACPPFHLKAHAPFMLPPNVDEKQNHKWPFTAQKISHPSVHRAPSCCMHASSCLLPHAPPSHPLLATSLPQTLTHIHSAYSTPTHQITHLTTSTFACQKTHRCIHPPVCPTVDSLTHSTTHSHAISPTQSSSSLPLPSPSPRPSLTHMRENGSEKSRLEVVDTRPGRSTTKSTTTS